LASVAIGLIACVQHALSSHTPVSSVFAAVSGVLMLVDLLELDGAETGGQGRTRHPLCSIS
jgi:uncharacterized protein involved in response to NO